MGLRIRCAICSKSFHSTLLAEAGGGQTVALEGGWRELAIRRVVVSGAIGDERRLYVHSDECEAELHRRTRMGRLIPSRQDLAERLLTVTCDQRHCTSEAFARFTRIRAGDNEVSRINLLDGWKLVEVIRRIAPDDRTMIQHLYACSEECESLLEIGDFKTPQT